MCIAYQLHPDADPVFYVTDVAIPPLVFGIGLAGNLLLLLVLNRRFLRRDSAVYVYYTATCVVDLLALLCAVPLFVRDVDLFPLDVAYSRPMAYAVWVRRAVEPMFRHSAGWFTTMAVAIRYAGTRLADSPARWTRISASRIVVFVLFVSCVLLDFTRFLDASVIELTSHCFSQMSLWTHNVTQLGVRRFYVDVHPAASVVAGEVLPLLLTLLFSMLLLAGHLGCCRRRRRTPLVLVSPTDNEEREYQLSSTVFAVSLAFQCLEVVTAVTNVVRVFIVRDGVVASTTTDKSIALHYLLQIGQCLSLTRCAVNFIIISLFSHDFRKALRRTFCCCCTAADDVYYEPVTCCSCCSSSRPQLLADTAKRSLDNSDKSPPSLISSRAKPADIDYLSSTVDGRFPGAPMNSGGWQHAKMAFPERETAREEPSLWI